MPAPVTWQEHAPDTSKATEQQRIRWAAPGRGDLAPLLLLKPVNVVEAGTADDANDGLQ
jgi:hypothetical protein